MYSRQPSVIFRTSVGLLLLVALVGCQGTTGQGTLYTVGLGGELVAFLPSDLKTVHDAALAVVTDEFKYKVERAEVDAHEGIISAKTARDRDVRIGTYKHSDGVTKIDISVANQPVLAELLLGQIEIRIRQVSK